MDVNSAEWSKREFQKLAEFCDGKDSSLCFKTGFACRDFLCPIVKDSKDIKEVRERFARQ